MNSRLAVLGGVLCLSMCSVVAAGVTVLPGGSTVAGKSIGQWTADWWNWAGSISPGVFADTTGAQAGVNQSGRVYFVAGTSGGSTVERNFDVPPGKFVLFPLLNWVIANGADPGFTDTQSEAEAITTGTIDPTKLFATLDGQDVPNLASHREKSPVNFTFTVVANSTGFPAGTYTDANADGYFLMLEPLSPGQHTLHFGGTSTDFTGPDPMFTVPSFMVDVTSNVTVGAQAIPLPPAALATLPVVLGAAMVAGWRRRRAAA